MIWLQQPTIAIEAGKIIFKVLKCTIENCLDFFSHTAKGAIMSYKYDPLVTNSTESDDKYLHVARREPHSFQGKSKRKDISYNSAETCNVYKLILTSVDDKMAENMPNAAKKIIIVVTDRK